MPVHDKTAEDVVGWAQRKGGGQPQDQQDGEGEGEGGEGGGDQEVTHEDLGKLVEALTKAMTDLTEKAKGADLPQEVSDALEQVSTSVEDLAEKLTTHMESEDEDETDTEDAGEGGGAGDEGGGGEG